MPRFLSYISVYRLRGTPQLLFLSPVSQPNDTDCLSLPSGSAGEGGKSTEAAAMLGEEAAQQRARD